MRRRALVVGLGVVLLGGAGLWAMNTSWLASPGPGTRSFLAHRGAHQTFDHEGIDGDTCTATRIHEPTHGFVENTAPSIRAALDAGASRVELDLRATADGALVVFHDYGLDCRTDGVGLVREHTLAELRGLDLGYGYTADGGVTYPLRGTARGSLMTIEELLAAFPDARLLLDLKDLAAEDAERLAAILGERSDVWATGREAAVEALAAAKPDVRGVTRGRVKACLLRYAALGWTGHVPEACRGSVVMVPSDYAPWLWGWPHRFTRRMAAADAPVVVLGPLGSGRLTRGVDDLETLAGLGDYRGVVWTNEILSVNPSTDRLRAR